MNPLFDYSSLSTPEDVQRLGEILDQCFGSPPDDGVYFNIVGRENLRVLRQSSQIAGGLALIPMSQWWNGQRVSMTGIASVGVAPEYRGSGAAISLMKSAVQDLHAQGVALSVLYPAVQSLYRKAGYEQAGNACGWEVPLSTIQLRERSLTVQRIPLDRDVFDRIYQQQANITNGHLYRPTALWNLLLNPQKETLYGYLFGSIDHPEGYVVFSHERVAETSILRVKDWITLTTAAGQTLWSFLADHRFQTEKVRWKGATIDPLTLLLPEQTAKLKFVNHWMLRIVNVKKSLEQRGYPSGLQTELHLDVRDDLLPENNGKFKLSVSEGRGEVTQGGTGELTLDIRGLAPLYTGLFTPHQLQRAGYLEATDAAIVTATQIFAGASPWMPDFF